MGAHIHGVLISRGAYSNFMVIWAPLFVFALGDRRQLALQDPSEILRSLTHGRDRQRTAWRRLGRTSSFAISSDQTFHVLGVRHMMRMRIPSNILSWVLEPVLRLCFAHEANLCMHVPYLQQLPCMLPECASGEQ